MARLTARSSARHGTLAFALAASAALAQPATAPAGNTAGTDLLAEFAWLDGCWRGSVNQRDFREQWMAPRGGLVLGVSQTVMGGKTTGYEYLRIEARADGVYYVAVPSGQKEDAFRYTGVTVDTTGDRNDQLFTFENPALEFPRRIVYRRASGGWLYAQVEGKVNGADRQVIYPMRHVDCITGAHLDK